MHFGIKTESRVEIGHEVTSNMLPYLNHNLYKRTGLTGMGEANIIEPIFLTSYADFKPAVKLTFCLLLKFACTICDLSSNILLCTTA